MKVRLGKLQWRRQIVPWVLAGSLAVAVITYRLGTLVPGLSPSERTFQTSSRTIGAFILNPNHWLLHLLSWAAQQLPLQPAVALRVPSVILALTSLALFTYLAKRWYGRRSMVFGYCLFLTSAWLLHIGRFGSVDIEYIAIAIALLTANVKLSDDESDAHSWFAWLGIHLAALTVPGAVWLVIAGAAIQWRAVWHALQQASSLRRLASAGIVAVVLGAIAAGLVYQQNQVWDWLGIPALNVATLQTLPSAVLKALLAIAFQGPHRPEAWLAGLPMVDFFILAMFLVGLLFYLKHWYAARTHLLVSYLVLGLLLASFREASLSLLIPVLYIVALGGMAYMLHFWLRVFPRNPLARMFGVMLLAALVLTSCSYNLAQYFVAWPHNPETVSVYNLKR